jgi:exopolysaccharide biosynthesis polyprenyl glycosylphosphotransferase
MTTDRTLLPFLLLADCLLVILIFNLVGHFRSVDEHLIIWPLSVPFGVMALALYLIDGYRVRTDFIGVDYTSLHIIAGLAATIGVLLLTFVFIPPGYELQSSRGVIAASFLLIIPSTLGLRRLIYLQNLASRSEQNLVFVGEPANCAAFAAECQKMKINRPVIFAVPADDLNRAQTLLTGLTVRALPEFLAELELGRPAVEAIVLRESNLILPPEAAQQLLRLYFRGIPTYPLELFHEIYWRKIPLYRLNPTWLFQEGFAVAREPLYMRLKRLSDLALSSLGSVLFLPLVAVAAIAIWLDDRGPVFFRQTRIGRHGVPFRLFKLRTMRVGGDAGDPYTQASDVRITRVGRLLRTTRLDEVPQLWNVFRGEMSLIGPRAEWDRLVLDYERQIPCYYYRHLVKPGITGWAQVNYLYGAGLDDTLRKLEYDLYYIRHFSFLLDASIVLKTIHIMLFGRGR